MVSWLGRMSELSLVGGMEILMVMQWEHLPARLSENKMGARLVLALALWKVTM